MSDPATDPVQDRPVPSLRWWTIRIGAPLLLLGQAASEFLWGGNAVSRWVVGFATKSGIGLERTVRGMIALQIIAIAFALLFPATSTAIAWVTFVGLAFGGLAELSALVNSPGSAPLPAGVWVLPVGCLALGAAGIAILGRSAPAPSMPRAPVTAWRVFIALFVVGGALSIAARVVVPERAAEPTGIVNASSGGTGGIENVVFNPEEWVGHTIPETGLGRHLPKLTPATLEGTKWIVFYQATCGRCHEVFRAYFGGPQHDEVVAVAVPPPPDAPAAHSDQPTEIECEECLRLALPEGKRWIITTPTIVKVESGKVTCVTSSDYDRCRPGTGALPP